MAMIEIFGIKNCDTMKKALKWLDDHDIDYHFHDYKKAGIDRDRLVFWLQQAPWEQLINQRGTTWRKLPSDSKDTIDNGKAIELMLANHSLIKRPVLQIDNQVHLGFKPELYQQLFNH